MINDSDISIAALRARLRLIGGKRISKIERTVYVDDMTLALNTIETLRDEIASYELTHAKKQMTGGK